MKRVVKRNDIQVFIKVIIGRKFSVLIKIIIELVEITFGGQSRNNYSSIRTIFDNANMKSVSLTGVRGVVKIVFL